jgi:hypothetical protein
VVVKPADLCGDLGPRLEQLDRERDEVAEVDRLAIALQLLVHRVNSRDLGRLEGVCASRLFPACGDAHLLGAQGVVFRPDDLVLRARYGGKDVADEPRGIVEVLVVLECEPWELGLEQFDRLDAVHQPGVARQ